MNLSRQIAAFGLIGAILLGLFSSTFIQLNYILNQEYIAQNLCENKAKPEMQCNGKCYMMKQLKQNEEKQDAPQQHNRNYSFIAFVFVEQADEVMWSNNEVALSFYTANQPIHAGYPFKIEYPPTVV